MVSDDELRRCEELAEALVHRLRALRTGASSDPYPDLSDLRFADRLRTLRGWRGLSIQSLAERSELHANTIAKLEKGARPRTQTVQRLAKALEVPWLLLEGSKVDHE